MNNYKKINENKALGLKQLAVLIDPDKHNSANLIQLIKSAYKCNVDYIFVGGSLLTNNKIDECISIIKEYSDIPVILFPGSPLQINYNADSILFLSLISGRNPDMLIGNHVLTAPLLKNSKLEVISTGYILIESGKATAVQYISNTMPIPHDKNDIALSTAIAGEMLGLKLIFMDAGSGALKPISSEMISMVSKNISIPLIIGGGIKTLESAELAWNSGADIIVIGNVFEENDKILPSFTTLLNKINKK